MSHTSAIARHFVSLPRRPPIPWRLAGRPGRIRLLPEWMGYPIRLPERKPELLNTDPSPANGSPSYRTDILLWALVALIALAPLPLASNRPLPAAMAALYAGILLVIWALRVARGSVVAVPASRLRWPLILFGAVSLWIVVQALPIMPRGLADPIWGAASGALDTSLSRSISVDPNATLTNLMHLLSYAAVFWLALQLTRDQRHAQRALAAAALIGGAFALYGIAIYSTGNNWVLYYRKWTYFEALSSTFVNRNSYATFAGLGLLCATAWLIDSFRHLLSINRPFGQRIALVVETVFGRAIIRTLVTLMLLVALMLTGSRAGIASSLIGLFILLLTYARRSTGRMPQIATIGAVSVLAVGIVAALGNNLLISRLSNLDTDVSALDREIVYSATLDAIETAPWTGTGYGTYREVFAAYRPSALSSRSYWDKAHQVYLENALELGIPAALALNLSILLLTVELVRGLRRRRRNRMYAAVGLAATILVGLHSLLDFSLQIPAVSYFYAFVFGLAVSQSWPASRIKAP